MFAVASDCGFLFLLPRVEETIQPRETRKQPLTISTTILPTLDLAF